MDRIDTIILIIPERKTKFPISCILQPFYMWFTFKNSHTASIAVATSALTQETQAKMRLRTNTILAMS